MSRDETKQSIAHRLEPLTAPPVLDPTLTDDPYAGASERDMGRPSNKTLKKPATARTKRDRARIRNHLNMPQIAFNTSSIVPRARSIYAQGGMRPVRSYAGGMDKINSDKPAAAALRARTPNVQLRRSFTMGSIASNPSDVSLSSPPSADSLSSHRNNTFFSTQTDYKTDNIGPFNTIEVIAISTIILLLVSLFVYHCQKTSKIEAALNEGSNANTAFKRTKLKRHHSFSRSASFASNLESVEEEPPIFDTRLADKLNKEQMEQERRNGKGKASSFLEPWYKWLQHDSPKSNPQINKPHQSENDLEAELDANIEMNGEEKRKFESPLQSYLITVTTKPGQETQIMPRSLSLDSYF